MRLGNGSGSEGMEGAAVVASEKNVELVGANSESLPIQGGEARTSVKLDTAVRRKVSASLSAAARPVAAERALQKPTLPDRVFLNLENVRGLSDAAAFQVYVGLPEGAKPADHPDRLAGSVGLFGVRKASLADGEHAGQGLTFALEITNIVDALHLNNSLDVDSLDVRIVPTKPVPEQAKVSIGRVSIFRQGH